MSAAGALNPLPNSSAGTGAGVGAVGCAQDCSVLYPCARGGVLIHCGCAGTLTSGAVPYPVIFPSRRPR